MESPRSTRPAQLVTPTIGSELWLRLRGRISCVATIQGWLESAGE
ncbi:hypothetical protein I551_3826 [Mycobacterium ulcerans str. Harvey]|uniref:Uncharacterized protein n=1 Tax=Mycobacterium ulcerans str. Harvey TaxID=1299332 RepID=A0ABN0QYF7_MYCUL|nr:hypothetical protein I551_3826 [Mycobacterium ulcerans str. Harvey]